MPKDLLQKAPRDLLSGTQQPRDLLAGGAQPRDLLASSFPADHAALYAQQQQAVGHEPEKVQTDFGGIEADPWVDATTAVTGPLGFLRGIAKKAGVKAAAKLGAKVIPGSVVAEPVIGGAMEYVDKATGEMPGYVRGPLTLGSGLLTGAALTGGTRTGLRGAEILKHAVTGVPEQSSKSKMLQSIFQDRFFDKPIQPPEIVDAAMQAGVKGAPSPTQAPKLVTNPLMAKAQRAKETLHKYSTGAYEKFVGTPLWDTLTAKQLPALLEPVPGAKGAFKGYQKLAHIPRKLFEPGYRGNLDDPDEFNQGLRTMRTQKALGGEYGVDVGNRLMALDESSQIKVADYITGGPDAKIDDKLKPLADEAKDALYHLGKRAVELDLLDEETFFKNIGRYMPRLYSSKEYSALTKRFKVSPAEGIGGERIKRRKDIPKAKREEMGEILTPGYPVAKGIAQLTNDLEAGRFFKSIADNPKWAIPTKQRKFKTADGTKVTQTIEPDTPIPDNWKQLQGKKYGALDGAYVHPEIAAEIKHFTEPLKIFRSETAGKAWGKGLGMWKFGKVILSPKTHMRNVLSNSVLAHLGGMSIPEQPYYLTKAAKELSQGGEIWRIGKETGLLDSTFVNKEIRGLFDQVSSQMKGIRAGSIEDKIGVIAKGSQVFRDGMRGAANLYQAEEQWFKLAKLMHNLDKGMSPERAARDAEKWLFNYGDLTRFQSAYRSSPLGAPFATFSFKALPRIAEAGVKTPWRFALPAALIYGIQHAAQEKIGDTDEQFEAKKELRPEWQKGGLTGFLPNFARFPIVDDAGREYYLNLTYTLPWGDVGERGDFMGIPGSLMPLSQPFVSELYSQRINFDPFFRKQIVPDEDVAGKGWWDELKTRGDLRLRHAYNTFAPTLALDIEKGVQAARGKPGPFGGYYDYRGRTKAPVSVFLDTALGIKTYPVSYEDQLVNAINEKAPDKGILGRKIQNNMRRLAVQMHEAKKDGKDTSWYEEQMQERRSQLIGLAKEVGVIAETYKKATGDTQ